MCGDNVVNTCIYVVKQDLETLLSGRVCEELGIIEFKPQPDHQSVRRTSSDGCSHKTRLAAAFPSVFEDKVGRLRNHTVKLHVDETVKPVAERRRPVAFHLRKGRSRELQKMEDGGLIEEHQGPAPWVSNTVLTPKPNGGTRVTVDMRNVNKAIKPTNIPIPRVEEITSELAGSGVFSKLDFRSAFHQLEIDEESRYLTVFHGDDGRLMRYCVLTMGSTPASGELAKALRPLLQHIKGVHLIHDDVIIATTDEDEHERVLNTVLGIIEESGMTLNLDKCMFHKSEVPFWGMLVNKDGVRPDPEKVEALKQATPPRNKQELVSFLCMIQSNKDFIPLISRETSHLRQLTKKGRRFKWTKECQREFETLKDRFSEEMLLNHFDPNKSTFIRVDAHRSGLSAILMQGKTLDDAKPVACASRSTTPVEQRYPQLDLEALAVDYGLRRFRYYCVGGPTVMVVTDHKPLLGVFRNTRTGSIRSDRIKLRHQDIRYELFWQKGVDNQADFLSRHGIPFTKLSKKLQNEAGEFEKTVWFLQFSPYTEAISFEKIIKETEKDPLLKELARSIHKGYITSNDSLKPFRKVFQDLTISDEGLILKGEKIVLPEKLHDKALKKAHQGGHPGMNGLKRRLRSHFWFPKMDAKIEETVASCQHCVMYTNKRTREPLYPHATSNEAWEDVSVDLFGPMPDRKHVLAVIDKSSRFPAAKVVPNTSATAVTGALSQIYADYGYPLTHQTDNGPPFNSENFATFSAENGIQHVKTHPYHPSGNPVENFMRPLGKTMKAAHSSRGNKDEALNQMLSNYRATPHPSTGIAPGNIMFHSGYRKDFPRIKVNENSIEAALSADREERERRALETNKSNHRTPSNLQPNQLVFIRNNKRNKFDPIFGPELHKVVDLKGNGVVLLRLSDDKIVRRHCDDVKVATAVTTEDNKTCWIDGNLTTSNTTQQPSDNPVIPPPVINNGWCNISEDNILPNRSRRGGIRNDP